MVLKKIKIFFQLILFSIYTEHCQKEEGCYDLYRIIGYLNLTSIVWFLIAIIAVFMVITLYIYFWIMVNSLRRILSQTTVAPTELYPTGQRMRWGKSSQIWGFNVIFTFIQAILV